MMSVRQLKAELKRMEGQAILFLRDNPTIIFTRNCNAEKQAFIELIFSENAVENPEKRKGKIEAYIR